MRRFERQQSQVIGRETTEVFPGRLRLQRIELAGALLDGQRAGELCHAPDCRHQFTFGAGVPSGDRRAVRLVDDESDQCARVEVDHAQ